MVDHVSPWVDQILRVPLYRNTKTETNNVDHTNLLEIKATTPEPQAAARAIEAR